ncbi:hypothetical protein [Aminipila sp.]|uniref:hypothetical protein n=1 Tax=Aminipila sp. TaxID=2060095 RepID=UPI00289CFB9C|nr:hypothetical protein [Aminipila sp.]
MNIKKIISFLTILAIVFASSTVCFAGNSINETQNITPTSYIKYMQDKLSSAKHSKDAAAIAIAESNISKFKSLSKEEQQKFINYISDPTLMKKAINNLSDLSTTANESTSLKNGDICITSECLDSSSLKSSLKASNGAEKTYTISYQPKMEVLGITIFETINTLKYKGTSKKVTSITSFKSYVAVNYNPFAAADFKNKSTEISDNAAVASIDVVFSWSYKIGEIVTGSCRSHVIGFPGGESQTWTEQLSGFGM